MLSDQTCTNQTGYHRRQQSTPTLSALNRPFLLPRTPQHNDPHRRGLSVDETSSVAAEQGFRSRDLDIVDENIRQQNGQPHLQETQQTRARPGQIEYLRQNRHTIQLQDTEPTPVRQTDENCLAAEDIDALILGLGPVASPVNGQSRVQMLDFTHPQEMTTPTDNLALGGEQAGIKSHFMQDGKQAIETQPCSTQIQQDAGARLLDRRLTAANEHNMSQYSQ